MSVLSFSVLTDRLLCASRSASVRSEVFTRSQSMYAVASDICIPVSVSGLYIEPNFTFFLSGDDIRSYQVVSDFPTLAQSPAHVGWAINLFRFAFRFNIAPLNVAICDLYNVFVARGFKGICTAFCTAVLENSVQKWHKKASVGIMKTLLDPVNTGVVRVNGAIAQLGERYNGIVEVSGSIPLSSTKPFQKVS